MYWCLRIPRWNRHSRLTNTFSSNSVSIHGFRFPYFTVFANDFEHNANSDLLIQYVICYVVILPFYGNVEK